MEDVLNITRLELDALREVGNIGSGNAATALAQFLNRKIDMAVPNASIMELNDIPNLVGGANKAVLGIFLKIMGEIDGRLNAHFSTLNTSHVVLTISSLEPCRP